MFGPYINQPHKLNPVLPHGAGPIMPPPNSFQPIHRPPPHGTGPVMPPPHSFQPIHRPPPHGTGPVIQPPHGTGPVVPPHHVDMGCHFPPPAPVRIYCQPAAFNRIDGEPYQNMGIAYGSSRPLNRYAP